MKVYKPGGHTTDEFSDIYQTNWLEGLDQGGIFSVDASSEIDNAVVTKIVLVPVLLGNSDQGTTSFTCDDKYGYTINI